MEKESRYLDNFEEKVTYFKDMRADAGPTSDFWKVMEADIIAASVGDKSTKIQTWRVKLHPGWTNEDFSNLLAELEKEEGVVKKSSEKREIIIETARTKLSAEEFSDFLEDLCE